MAAGHDEDHREQPGHRQRVEDDPRPPEPSAAAQRDRVEEHRHPVGIDDRQQPVEERDEVQDEDAGQDPRREEEPEQLRIVGSQDDAGEQGEQQNRRGREAQGAVVGAGVGMAEPGKEEGEDSRDERRPRTLARLLRRLHRG